VLPRLPATTICFILFQVLQLLRVLLSKPPASPSSNPGPLTAVYSSTPRRRTKNSQSRPSRLSWFSFASSIRGQQKHAARHSTKRRYLLLMRRSEALRAIEIAARHRAGGNLQSMPMRRGVLFLIFMLAASGTPALADLLNVELTISFVAPDNFPAHSHLVRSARQLPSAFAFGRYRRLLPGREWSSTNRFARADFSGCV